MAGEAGSAAALGQMLETRVDLAVVDISLEGTDGLELIKQLKAEHPALQIVVMSVHPEEVYALRALRAGAHGYVTKVEHGETILRLCTRC